MTAILALVLFMQFDYTVCSGEPEIIVEPWSEFVHFGNTGECKAWVAFGEKQDYVIRLGDFCIFLDQPETIIEPLPLESFDFRQVIITNQSPHR